MFYHAYNLRDKTASLYIPLWPRTARFFSSFLNYWRRWVSEMVLPSSKNTSDDSMPKEIWQRQRKGQTSSPECQKYKKNDISKINLMGKHGTQPCRIGYLYSFLTLNSQRVFKRQNPMLTCSLQLLCQITSLETAKI